MIRIGYALLITAASMLFAVSAFAADATAQDLPQDVAQHWVVLLAAAVIAGIRTSLSDDTIRLPVWAAKSRVRLIAVLGLAATSIEQVMNGLDVGAALLGFAIASAPSLIQEFIKKIAGSEPPKWASTRPPPMPPTSSTIPPPANLKLAALGGALVLCVALVALPGCAALRTACRGIDLAKEGCDYFVITLPDETTETVSRKDLTGFVQQTRAARLSAAARGAADAGADQ